MGRQKTTRRESTPGQRPRDTVAEITWIGKREIVSVPGALKPGAYVARAYLHAKQHGGRTPSWARKQKNGRWLFDRGYIERDARERVEFVGVTEAAKLLGVTRPTIQGWVDEGVIATEEAGPRETGAPRRIPRDAFLRALPELRERLQTPAVIGYRLKHGKPVDPGAADRVAAEREIRETLAEEQRLSRRLEKSREEMGGARTRRVSADVETAREARRRASDQRRIAERASREAHREWKAAAREAERRAAQERGAVARETRLKDAARAERERAAQAERAAREEAGLRERFAARLRAAKVRRARAIEQQLEEARRQRVAAAEKARRKAEEARRLAAAREETLRAEKRRRAEAIESRLKEAKELKRIEAAHEKQARAVAERILNDMLDDRISRHDAMVLFGRIVRDKGLRPDVCGRISSEYFGRGRR
jgi:excisionase family DNA binding protein